jgi:hypothetical protein
LIGLSAVIHLIFTRLRLQGINLCLQSFILVHISPQDSLDFAQRELAEKLGISVGGLNDCLNEIMEKCSVKIKSFTNSINKFIYAYLLILPRMATKAAISLRLLQDAYHP